MHLNSKKNIVDVDSLSENILGIVINSPVKLTPVTLEKKLIEEYALNKRQIKSAVRELVAEGALAYTYEYGCTFIEQSFNKPVRVSKHIVLQPPGYHHDSGPDDVIVKIRAGAAFGFGNHPTTRLAIKGIEFVLLDAHVIENRYNSSLLDIGTGSGVLLITAVLCGIQTGLGIDIDACARVEAAKNVQINGIERQVAVSGQSLADIRQTFTVISANLRTPSLKKLYYQISESADPNAILILSGIKDNELDDVLKVYEKVGFKKIWGEDESGWTGVVLRRFNSTT